jgi:hypothetical protein
MEIFKEVAVMLIRLINPGQLTESAWFRISSSFLKNFNITPCSRSTDLERQADESIVFLDRAFTGIKTQAKSSEKLVLEEVTTSYLSTQQQIKNCGSKYKFD